MWKYLMKENLTSWIDKCDIYPNFLLLLNVLIVIFGDDHN